MSIKKYYPFCYFYRLHIIVSFWNLLMSKLAVFQEKKNTF